MFEAAAMIERVGGNVVKAAAAPGPMARHREIHRRRRADAWPDAGRAPPDQLPLAGERASHRDGEGMAQPFGPSPFSSGRGISAAW